MAFRADHQNPVQDLCEISIRVARSDNESDIESVLVTLGIFSAEIAHDAYPLTVQISKASLSLGIVGLDVVPGSKLGMSNETHFAREIIRENLNESYAEHGKSEASSGGLKLSVKDAGADVHSKLETSSKEQKKSSEKTAIKSNRSFLRVRAKNRNIWEVREEQSTHLDDHYLNDDELCRLSPQTGANRRSVSLTVYAKQKDIEISAGAGRVRKIITRATDRSLFAILAAKTLHESSSGAAYKGIVHLSHSECVDED